MGVPVIADVLVTPLKRIDGAEGGVMHALRASAPGFAGFGEAYFSEIHCDATKKWRRHRRMTLNLVVPRGNVRFVIFDDRGASPSRAVFAEYTIGEMNYIRLTVPPGLWMAFRGEGPGTSLILDITNEEHDPQESDIKELSAIDYVW